MMRIAYVCADPGIPVFGNKGCSIHVQEVLRALMERGAQVDLFAYLVGGETPHGLHNLRVHTIDVDSNRDLSERERSLLATNHRLKSLLAEEGPFDLVYERHALWSYAAMDFAREQQIPGILEVNAPLMQEQSTHRQLLDSQTAETVSAKAIRSAAAVVAVSELVAEYVCRLGGLACRVHVVANGVRPERYLASNRQVAVANTFQIGFLGSLRPWHGVPDLISAFSRLPSDCALPMPQLSIVGDGPQRTVLEWQAGLLPTKVRRRVRFMGNVPYDSVPAALATFDVAVAPYAEAQECYFSPLKVFEYMAAGLPIVAARAGQLAEIIDDDRNGLLYPPGDIAALASRLERLRSQPELRRRLGDSARRDAERQHTWQQRIDAILRYAQAFPKNLCASAM